VYTSHSFFNASLMCTFNVRVNGDYAVLLQ
jgi:hypothetical protein